MLRGVLVIPKWLSAAFWPTFFPMGGLRPSVLQVLEFSDPSFVFALFVMAITRYFVRLDLNLPF